MKKENSHSQPIQDDAFCQDPDHSNRVYFAKNKWLTVHYFFLHVFNLADDSLSKQTHLFNRVSIRKLKMFKSFNLFKFDMSKIA